MLHETSLLLSRITAHAAVVIGPQPDAARVRSVQLVRLHETSLLVVAVLSNGQVERQFIELAGEIDEGRIGAAIAVLDTQLRDASFTDLPALTATRRPRHRQARHPGPRRSRRPGPPAGRPSRSTSAGPAGSPPTSTPSPPARPSAASSRSSSTSTSSSPWCAT